MPAWSGVSTFISGGRISQTVLHSQVVDFVGGAGPATGAQQHLQWCSLACRGCPLPSNSPRVPVNPNLENQPSWVAAHLDDVGLRGHWIVDVIDVEDDRRQGVDCITGNHILLERRREVGPEDPYYVGRLGVTLWHDPSPQNPGAWRS